MYLPAAAPHLAVAALRAEVATAEGQLEAERRAHAATKATAASRERDLEEQLGSSRCVSGSCPLAWHDGAHAHNQATDRCRISQRSEQWPLSMLHIPGWETESQRLVCICFCGFYMKHARHTGNPLPPAGDLAAVMPSTVLSGWVARVSDNLLLLLLPLLLLVCSDALAAMQRQVDETATRSRDLEQQQVLAAAEAARLREQVSLDQLCLCCAVLCCAAPLHLFSGAASQGGRT